MKKLAVIFWLTCSVAMAQIYNGPLDGTYQPAKVILGDGVVRDVKMEYRSPEYFKNPMHHFRITSGDASNGISTNPDGSFKVTNADGSVQTFRKGSITVFMIDNIVWVQRIVNGQNQFVALRRQGAIEQFDAVINGKMGDFKDEPSAYVVIGDRAKLMTRNTTKNEVVSGTPTEEKMRDWIADVPDAVTDFKNAEAQANSEQKKLDSLNASASGKPAQQKKGLMGALEKAAQAQQASERKATTQVDLNRIMNNYNAYYDQGNPGKVQYYFASPATSIPLPRRVKSQEEIKAERTAKLEDLFAGRSSTVAPDVASSKDNTPVKKETFAQKIARINADGNKIGVVIYTKPIVANKPDPTRSPEIGFSPVDVPGEINEPALMDQGKAFVEELNAALATTGIELVDITRIPYREIKVLGQTTRIDDWWATKYKVVFAYTIEPQIKATHSESMGFDAYLQVGCSLMVTEYIGDKASNKRDLITQVMNMGGFNSPSLKQKDDLIDINALYKILLEKIGSPLSDKMKAERADAMTKLVEKKLN